MFACVCLGIPYQITVYTGDKRSAGTDARVYVMLCGKKTSSSQIFLSGGKFERKCVDPFTIDGPEDISPLTELVVGHDNSGSGPGWYLDKVSNQSSTTTEINLRSIFFDRAKDI